jgi:DNA-binding transcriptional ArsR family regulator
MTQYNGHASLEETIETLVVAKSFGQDFVTPQEPPEGIPLEPPSRKAQLDRQYIYLPMRLFIRVAPLPGKAAVVYQLAWREGVMHFTAVVKLASASLRLCGISRYEKSQALRSLEEAGLITVTRQRGKNPQVTVLALVGRFGRTSTR